MAKIWEFLIVFYKVSITPGMAGIGALFAANVADKYGRKKVKKIIILYYLKCMYI
jgi:MFS family permease